MFGAHEKGGLIWAYAPLSKTTYYYKVILNLQNQPQKTK